MVNEINAEQQHGVEKVGGQAVVDSSANYYHSLPNQNSGQYLFTLFLVQRRIPLVP